MNVSRIGWWIVCLQPGIAAEVRPSRACEAQVELAAPKPVILGHQWVTNARETKRKTKCTSAEIVKYETYFNLLNRYYSFIFMVSNTFDKYSVQLHLSIKARDSFDLFPSWR